MDATQCKWVSSSCFTASTPFMNDGNSSNCVHWLYAVETGTSTSTDFSMLGTQAPLLGWLFRIEKRSESPCPGGNRSNCPSVFVRSATGDNRCVATEQYHE